jgi:hypothetical protein
MSGQDLPTYLRGHSLSRPELATALGTALLGLCQSATADGRLSPDELEALKQWLVDAESARMPAVRYLRTVIDKVLADGKITPEECRQVYRAVESILPVEARLRALAARQQVEAAEAAAARPARVAGNRRVVGVPAIARIGLIVAVLAMAGALWLSS